MTVEKFWENLFKSRPWGKYPSENLIRFVAKNFYHKKRSEIRILEVGCGPGPNIWFLSREGFKAYGIDGSKSAIIQAEKRLKSDGLKANLLVGDIKILPYADGYFDAVIDVECLYSNNRADTEIILTEIRRVLKNDGLFFSRSFSVGSYLGKRQKKIGRFEYSSISDGSFKNQAVVRLIDKKTIRDLYGKIFSVISIDKEIFTINNGRDKNLEWVIVCQKNKRIT